MKEIARMQNLGKRNILGWEEIKRKSRLIEKKFLALQEFRKARRAMLYFGVRKEVETKGIVQKALEKGKKVFLPVTDFGKRAIKPIEISSLGELKETRQGLFEPTGRNSINASELDLIVVPGIAFDGQGNRLGTGKGFYDSLLRRTSTNVLLIGLCFEENLEENLPVESHDVKMDLVVTDKQVIRIG